MEKYKRGKDKTKVQCIKTGGYYISFENFIDMLISRSINNVNYNNTICIVEKPFSKKKKKLKQKLTSSYKFQRQKHSKIIKSPKSIEKYYTALLISLNFK